MARQDLTVTTGTSRYPTTGAVLTFTAADTSNFERFVLTGTEVVLVWNTGASPYTYTVTSTAENPAPPHPPTPSRPPPIRRDAPATSPRRRSRRARFTRWDRSPSMAGGNRPAATSTFRHRIPPSSGRFTANRSHKRPVRPGKGA